jgi:alkanesulfonate monooxygenase SsuD/methylene tetrahydromethanopterin reductase-like flavin-dependent oxidoreductase (luciferase family)
MLDDLLGFLHEWWTTTPVSWESEFFSLPPVHADLRPVQAGGPPVWIGGASEAAMRRVGRSGTGWLGVEGLQAEVADHLWSITRRAAQGPYSLLPDVPFEPPSDAPFDSLWEVPCFEE